jgi:hypothetical protein
LDRADRSPGRLNPADNNVGEGTSAAGSTDLDQKLIRSTARQLRGTYELATDQGGSNARFSHSLEELLADE